MRLLRYLTAAFCVLLPPLAAQADQVSTFTLENGLDVVVIEDHRAPLVVQMIWYRAGAADEPAGKSGIAHFLEHLMFKGTEKVPAGQFSATVEANGGDDNAFTSFDYTAYFQRIAADRLELVMQMEADRMRGLRLTESDVATERQVILEERGQRTDSDPRALLDEQMNAALFLNHRYGIPIIGWRHEIEGLTRQDALSWYETYYAPNNATLVIAGDTTPEAVRALAEKYYGPIAPSKNIPPRQRPQEPPQLAARHMVLEDERVSDPYAYRLYLAPEREPGDQKQGAALSILAALLGGDAQTSYLSRALTFDSQIATWVAASYEGSSLDSGTFGLYLVPAPGVDLAQAEAALDAALARFIKEGPDPEAFARIKTQARADEIYTRDDVHGLASMYGAELSVGLSVKDIQDFVSVIDAVTPQDVTDAAAKVLDKRASVTGWLVRPEAPDGAAPPGDAATTAAPGPATEETAE